jgi:hypothetical protein
MLLGTGMGSTPTDDAIREASDVVMAAERRCAALHAERARSTAEALVEQHHELLARATRILGRTPDADPVAELRARRVPSDAAVAARAALASALHDLGVETSDESSDVTNAAREYLARRDVDPGAGDDVAQLEASLSQLHRERAETMHDARRHRAELDRLSADRERIESRLAVERSRHRAAVEALSPTEATDRSVMTLLHRANAMANGLPLVVEDPFGDLDDAARTSALDAFAHRAGGETQVILVTASEATVAWARDLDHDLGSTWTAGDARALTRKPARV